MDCPARRRRFAVAVLSLVGFLTALDYLVVVVALPSIQRELAFSQATLPWVISAYGLAFGGFLLSSGRAADLVGRRRMLGAGLAVFASGSLLGGLAPHAAVLVVGRALQGLGEALVAPASLALVAAIFPDSGERSRAIGIVSGAASAGIVAGTVLGGVVTETLGWRWVLLLNVPVAALALALVVATVPESRRRSAPRSFDLAGAATATAGLAALLYAITHAERAGLSAGTLLALAASAVLLTAFVAIERRTDAPLVRFGFFRLPGVAGANVGSFAASAGYASVLFLTTLYLQQVDRYSALTTSVALLPFALAVVLGSPVAGRLAAAVGPRLVAPVGLVLTAAGMLVLAQAPAGNTYLAHVLPATLLAGLGAPLAYVPLTSVAFDPVGPDERGLAAGLYETSAQIGGSVAVAVAAAASAAGADRALARGAAETAALADGLAIALLLAAAFLLAAAPAVARLLAPAPSSAAAAPRAEATSRSGAARRP